MSHISSNPQTGLSRPSPQHVLNQHENTSDPGKLWESPVALSHAHTVIHEPTQSLRTDKSSACRASPSECLDVYSSGSAAPSFPTATTQTHTTCLSLFKLLLPIFFPSYLSPPHTRFSALDLSDTIGERYSTLMWSSVDRNRNAEFVSSVNRFCGQWLQFLVTHTEANLHLISTHSGFVSFLPFSST